MVVPMRSLVKRMAWLAASALLLGGSVQAWASPVLTFNEATGAIGTNQEQSVGWQFNVLTPITVTGLGWFDDGRDGLATAHTIWYLESWGDFARLDPGPRRDIGPARRPVPNGVHQ